MAASLVRSLTGQSQQQQAPSSAEAAAPIAQQHPGLERTTTTNTLTGELNHLDSAQAEKLEIFRERLRKDGWYNPTGVNGKPTHDDGTLLRYLRARKFDIDGACGQFIDTEKWMKHERVEEFYEHFDVDFFEQTRQLYPQWTGHRDRRGIPLYVYEIKGLDSRTISKYEKDATEYKKKFEYHSKLATQAKLLPLFALYHNLLNFVLPLCSSLDRPRSEIPITNSTNIVDISGVSLRQFWNLKSHMQDASVLATAHYPETLDRIFIIGAPSFFPTVWGWIKRWFDPVTVSKIFILSKAEVLPTLERFMDGQSIPKKYGGTLDWAWGDDPDLDKSTREALERDGNKGWVRGPALWLNEKRVVVGSVDGQLRRTDKEVAQMKPIVYAADYTETPVHAERKASSSSEGEKHDVAAGRSSPTPNGQSAVAAQQNSTSPEIPREEADSKMPQTQMAKVPATKSIEEQPLPPGMPADSVKMGPMGDSRVHVPKPQAAPPNTTAEYISPTIQPRDAPAQAPSMTRESASVDSDHNNGAVVVPTVNAADSQKFTSTTHKPPIGHTQPGPLPSHTVELNRKIAERMEGESTVVIPASSEGPIPHPDIVVASDKSLGLAIEADKLALTDSDKVAPSRPQPERFVTAAQF